MPEDNKILEDGPEREKALDCKISIHCESPAGSGKTTLLTDRLLMLLSQAAHPYELLALTFTNKAAGEMRERIWDALKEADDGRVGDAGSDRIKAPFVDGHGLPLQAGRRPSNLGHIGLNSEMDCMADSGHQGNVSRSNGIIGRGEGFSIKRRETARRVLARHRDKRELLFSPDGLRIMTFHSLCYSIVKGSPLEAGVPAGVTIVEGVEYDTLLAQVTDESLKRIADSEGPGSLKRRALEHWLLRTNNNWSRLRSDCINLIKRRDYLKDLIALIGRHGDLSAFRGSIEEALGVLVDGYLGETAALLEKTELGKNWDEFFKCIGGGIDDRSMSSHELSILSGQVSFPVQPVLSERTLLPKWSMLPDWQRIAEVLTTKTGTPRKSFRKEMGLQFCQDPKYVKEMIGNLPRDICEILNELKGFPVKGYDEGQIRALYDLIIIIGEVITDWQGLCQREGIIDFVGLELACLRALSQMPVPDIQLLLDSKIRHILVDEFQDTSKNQWVLLQRLCAGWAPGDGRTLFLVGDPKQSIYAFRKAEVSLFFEAKKGLPLEGQGRLGLETITLKNNFRSAPGLIAWTNALFEYSVMKSPRADMDEVPFSPSKATLDGEHELSLSIFVESTVMPDPQMAEANWLANALKALDQRIDKTQRIAVLLFTRTRLPLYLRALNDIGVPVNVTEGLCLTDAIEVQCIHQMTRALVYPHDDIAWIALLRTPWYWCTPSMLCRIRQMEGVAWVNKIAAYISAVESGDIRTDAEDEALQHWWGIIKRARMRAGRVPLSKVLKDAWLQMEGAYRLASLIGTNGVGNCLRYLEILDASERYVPEDTLTACEQMIANAFMPSPPEASRSRCEIMTVHRAKGLEFDYVFCPFLEWDPLLGGRGDKEPYLLEGSSEGRVILAVRKDQRQGEDDLIYKLLEQRKKGKSYGEAKRLFYVAVTRAKRGLILSGVAGVRDERITARCKASPLAYIIEHEGITRWRIDPDKAEGLYREGTGGINIRINPGIEPSGYAVPHAGHGQPLSSLPLAEGIEGLKDLPLKEGASPPLPLPEAFSFKPERLPYTVVSPSIKETAKGLETPEVKHTLSEITAQDALVATGPPSERYAADEAFELGQKSTMDSQMHVVDQDNLKERARGTIIHQILNGVSKGQGMPSERGVIAALYNEGVSPEDSTLLASQILSEIDLCLQEETCAWILRGDHQEAYAEFPIEDIPAEGTIRSGIIDRLIFDGGRWWIIDYKTTQKVNESGIEGHPDAGTEDAFFEQQADFYRKQMEAYRSMVSRWKCVPEEGIVMLIYFTAFQKAYRYP